MNGPRKGRTRAGFTATIQGQRALYGKRNPTTPSAPRNQRIPNNWRDRLPDPASYYAGQLERLSRPNGAGYAQARCCFHDDKTASLSVSLTGRGCFKCFACGEKGDLVSFHMRRTGLDFKAAVRELVGGAA